MWKTIEFHKFYLMKFDFFQSFNLDLKFLWNWSSFHCEKIMRFKKNPQLPGAGRTRAWHHHGSHTPTSPGAILLGKMAYPPNKSAPGVYSKSENWNFLVALMIFLQTLLTQITSINVSPHQSNMQTTDRAGLKSHKCEYNLNPP